MHSLCRFMVVLIQKLSSELSVSLASCRSVKCMYEIETVVRDIRKRLQF